MRFHTVLAGLAFAAGSIPGVAAASTVPAAPLSGHEQLCHQVHNSTAPSEVDQTMHERIPRPALNQICDPHGGHRDGPDPG